MMLEINQPLRIRAGVCAGWAPRMRTSMADHAGSTWSAVIALSRDSYADNWQFCETWFDAPYKDTHVSKLMDRFMLEFAWDTRFHRIHLYSRIGLRKCCQSKQT